MMMANTEMTVLRTGVSVGGRRMGDGGSARGGRTMTMRAWR